MILFPKKNVVDKLTEIKYTNSYKSIINQSYNEATDILNDRDNHFYILDIHK